MTIIQTKGTGVSKVPAGTKALEGAISKKRKELEQELAAAKLELRSFSSFRNSLCPKLSRLMQGDSIKGYKSITSEIKRLESELLQLS